MLLSWVIHNPEILIVTSTKPSFLRILFILQSLRWEIKTDLNYCYFLSAKSRIVQFGLNPPLLMIFWMSMIIRLYLILGSENKSVPKAFNFYRYVYLTLSRYLLLTYRVRLDLFRINNTWSHYSPQKFGGSLSFMLHSTLKAQPVLYIKLEMFIKFPTVSSGSVTESTTVSSNWNRIYL